jgi:anti-sigma regulatory factor (Ser/Thr protein kinase)
MTPGPDARRAELVLDPEASSVREARSFVRGALGGVAEEDMETAVLLASELVTNAILHTGSAVQLAVVVDDGRLLVCVGDHAEDGDVVVSHGHSVDRPGGRGLALVEGLSDRWGTEAHDDGKTVWFTLPVALTTSRAG